MTAPEAIKPTNDARPRNDTRPVDGTVLSCYSTAVAGLLEQAGLSHRAVLGGQLFLGVRRDGPLLEFLHQHTPSTGDGVVFRLDLERRGAADPETAGQQLADEARERGAVIVTGATRHLAWIDAPGVVPTPHWFVLRPAGDRFAVDDRFSWIDDAGEHLPYEALVTAAEAGALSASPPPDGPEAASRERWAFGVRRPRPAWDTERPWQWLAAEPLWHGGADTGEILRIMLDRSVRGEIADPATAAEGWVTGPAALRATRDWLADGLDDAPRYGMHNDVWIAGRNRELFARALDDAAALGIGSGLGDIAGWVRDQALPAWSSVVRLLRYNALRLARGGRPRPAVLTDLERLAAIEDELLGRLASALAR